MVLFAAFPHRLEYPAHLLAGMGVAGAGASGLWSVRWARRRPGLRATVVGGVVLVAALVADLTVTGPFDVLDVANTAMGGLLGVAAVVPAVDGSRAATRPRVWLGICGLVVMAAGLLLRYVVQDSLKNEWWFGS